MPDTLTLRKAWLATVGFLIAMQFGSSAIAAAQCLARGAAVTDQSAERDLRSSDGISHVYVLKQSSRVDLCVQAGRCVWHSPLAALGDLGSFAEFADGDSHCQGTHDQVAWEGRVYVTDCRMPDQLSQALSAISVAVAPILVSAPCGTLDSPLTDSATITSVDGSPAFVAGVPVGKLCLAIGVQLSGSYRAFAALVRSCPTDVAAAAIIASQWLGAGVATSQFSIGASFPEGGFGLTSAGPTFDLKAATPVVLGPVIEQGYVTAWLAAIRAAAEANTDLADGSVLEASTSDPIGRLAKWLAAGLMRLDARPFDETDPNWVGSAPARDWMTRTLLIDPNAMEGTLLRAENARKPWGAP